MLTRAHAGKIVGLILVTLAIAAWFVLRPAAPANGIAIVPARWTFIDVAGLDDSDERLAEAVTAQAIERGRLPVLAWREIRPYQTKPQQAPALARETGATRVMAISVRRTGTQSRVTVFLVEPFTGRKLWAEDFYAQELTTPESVRALAQTIVHDLETTLGAGA